MFLKENLMYVLKVVSGDSDNQIISHLYNLGIEAFNDAVSKKRIPRFCNRKIKVNYKNTGVCVSLSVQSTWLKDEHYRTGRDVDLWMDVGFDSTSRKVDAEAVSAMFAETGLGLADTPVFESRAPKEKKYRFQKQKDSESGVNYDLLPSELKAKYTATS
jgi:hypothetical protein